MSAAPKKEEKISDGLSTEDRLVAHVLKTAKKGDPESVLAVIDAFGWKEWMMNVGDVKGLILDKAIKERKPKFALEFGLYCGYSATRIARLLPADGRLVSVEKDPVRIGWASKIIAHAGLADRVQIIQGAADEAIPTLKAKTGLGSFDLVFIDHVKDRYLADLKILEGSGLLAKGTVLVADNIVYPGAPDYLEYVRTSSHYKSELHETKLEYKDDMKDAVCVSVRVD